MPKKEMMSMHDCCHDGHCHMCHGWKWTIAGLAILANAIWGFTNWWILIGVLVTLKGLSHLVMPHCPHCR